MESNDSRAAGRVRAQRSLDYLRRRSQHRIWWNSARVALRRGHSGEPINQPTTGHGALGKRV